MITQTQMLTMLSLSVAVPSIFLGARLYLDVYRRPSLSRPLQISLSMTVGAWFCLMLGASMAFWRDAHKGTVVMVPSKNRHEFGYEFSDIGLEKPLMEATAIHSYIIPTGLWLCKAGFVAMYFPLARHVSRGLKWMLWAVAMYTLVSYLTLVLLHVFWCGSWFKTWTSTPSTSCSPFTTSTPIAWYAFLNITSFLLIILAPLIILHHTPKRPTPRERAAIIFLLILGACVLATTSVCCALHITYRKELLRYYSFVQLAQLLACIELAGSVVAVCIPALRAAGDNRRILRRGARLGKDVSLSASGSKRDTESGAEGFWDEYVEESVQQQQQQQQRGGLPVLAGGEELQAWSKGWSEWNITPPTASTAAAATHTPTPTLAVTYTSDSDDDEVVRIRTEESAAGLGVRAHARPALIRGTSDASVEGLRRTVVGEVRGEMGRGWESRDALPPV